MDGQSASTSLVTEHQCPRVVWNEKLQRAAQGNPRIEGVSCAAYLFYHMSMTQSEGDSNEKQLVSQWESALGHRIHGSELTEWRFGHSVHEISDRAQSRADGRAGACAESWADQKKDGWLFDWDLRRYWYIKQKHLRKIERFRWIEYWAK